MTLAWKIVSLTGIAWESQAVFSPPTYSSPTDRWANSSLPRSIFQEIACEKKASERSCKVEHRVLTWRVSKSIDAVLMGAASQPCLGWIVPLLPMSHALDRFPPLDPCRWRSAWCIYALQPCCLLGSLSGSKLGHLHLCVHKQVPPARVAAQLPLLAMGISSRQSEDCPAHPKRDVYIWSVQLLFRPI